METIILLAVYLLFGLAGLAVAAWIVATGQFLDVDGLFVALVCLTLSAVFLGAFGLGVWKGEFKDALSAVRRSRSPSGKPAEASEAKAADSPADANTV